MLLDKGYSAHALLDWLRQRDITAVVPLKANQKRIKRCKKAVDWYRYKERYVIEYRFGNQILSPNCHPLGKKSCHFRDMLAFTVVLL